MEHKIKAVGFVTAVIISLASMIGMWPSFAASEGLTETVEVVETVAPENVYVPQKVQAVPPAAVSVPMMTPEESKWVYGVLEHFGLEPIDGLTIGITDEYNCGSINSESGTGGGCYYPTYQILIISPTDFGTEGSIITLLHEYAHASGIMNECEAEYFAHDLFETTLWSYETCYYNR